MSSPTIHHQHVSFLYVHNWSSPKYFAEVGWFANIPQSNKKPRFFCAWVINNTYYERLLEYPTPGTNHYYTVRNVTGSNEWRWYVDGVLKNTVSSLFLHSEVLGRGIHSLLANAVACLTQITAIFGVLGIETTVEPGITSRT